MKNCLLSTMWMLVMPPAVLRVYILFYVGLYREYYYHHQKAQTR